MTLHKIKCWDVVSVGERGQVVIPAKARRYLNINKGDRLLVVSRGKKFLGLIKVDEVSLYLKKWLAKIEKLEKGKK